MRLERRDADAVRFDALWEAHAGRVLAHATRHVGADAAQEVVAETFLVAWRRLVDVPEHALPWLLVVARNTVSNQRRSTYRRAVLHEELGRLQSSAASAPAAEVTAGQRAEVLEALAVMSLKEREALLLVTWDGLSVPQAARVAGCSTSAMHVRLFRARRRLQACDDASDAAGSGEDTAQCASAPRTRVRALPPEPTSTTCVPPSTPVALVTPVPSLQLPTPARSTR